jgi:hypothetical protein
VRLFLSLVFVFAAVAAYSDPLIDIPTARKLPYETFKLEFANQITDDQTQLLWLDAGIGKSLEATFSTERFGREPVKTSEDLMYSVISALPGVSPGIAFGVQDIANTSQDHRRFYGVVTIREPTETFDGEIPYDLTVGFYYRKNLYPFFGFALPLSHKVKVMIENNGDRPAGGIEYVSSHALSFRLLFRGANTLGDVMWTARF